MTEKTFPDCDISEIPQYTPRPKPGSYEAIGAEIGRLVDRKQKAYGRSFDKTGDVIKILYPSGIRHDQYADLLAIVRILDKFFRIATNPAALGESPWADIAGYALLKNRDYIREGNNG